MLSPLPSTGADGDRIVTVTEELEGKRCRATSNVKHKLQLSLFCYSAK